MLNSELLNYISGTKKNIALNVLFRWFGLLMNILISFSIVWILNQFYQGENPDYLFFIFLLTGLWLLKFFFERKAELYGFSLSQKVKKHLRLRFLRKIIKIGPSYSQKMPSSKILQLAGDGVEQLQTYYSGFMPQLFFSILATLTMVVLIAFINVRTSLVLLIFSPLIPIVIYKGLSIARKILGRYWKSYFDLGSTFMDNIQGLTIAKIYNADEYKHKVMNEKAEDFRVKTMKLLTMQLNSINVMDIIAFGGVSAGIITAFLQLRKGNIAIEGFNGDTGLMGMILILLLCYDFFVPLRILGSLFHVAMNGIFASTFITDFLNLPDENNGKEISDKENFDITINAMSFSFNENDFIKGINIIFPQNQMTSIVGKSGCGKSTIVNILSGILTGYKGSIKIGNTENRDLMNSYRMKHINIITHNPYFFKGSVRENMLLANENATDNDIEQALKEVNLLNFINSQNGLDTLLNANAENFSGGQKQRLAIARALLQNPDVFIFDEATSNIEAESEEIIMSLIEKLKQEKTIILISHRLSNVVKSDNIYYMEDGNIIEKGTHNELISAGNKYAKLYQYQKELESYGKN
ncbi:MAG: cysteine ABC transporter ATP-binding protein [Chryseobacterium sp.]|nr:MAG: cysteine ABC transporter ATP-binding protein [Chryseobacterium sp.]